MKIIGKQKTEGVSKTTGNPYKGINLFLLYEAKNIEGEGAMKQYVSSTCTGYEDVVNAPIGSEIDFKYNRWGSVDTVVVL